jgi:hypothetical protein
MGPVFDTDTVNSARLQMGTRMYNIMTYDNKSQIMVLWDFTLCSTFCMV